MPWKIISRSIGISEGGSLNALFAKIGAALGLAGAEGRGAVNRAAFTAAVVALSAKLSKSDGVALTIEAETFEHLFPVEDHEIDNVRWLFGLAAQDVAGFEAYAGQIARALDGQPELKHDVFEALLHIATADGVLHEGEDRYLSRVSELFGYVASEYRAARARFVRDDEDPYVVLGIAHKASDAELKAHYRRLMRESHPDALAARGLARELQELAQRKTAAINAAWDKIARERGL